jgi:prepilin-type N-terminal cleavage/methylation domain-containing protein
MRTIAVYRQYQTNRSAGFTLIEVLVVIALLSLVFGTVYRSFANVNRSYTNENVKAGVQQKARIGIDLMARDIRLAGLDPLGSANTGFDPATTNSSSIGYTADLNYDGDIDDPFEDMVYSLNGHSLEQTSHLGTATLMDNVSALSFTYLDAEENVLPVPLGTDQIRTVLISLTVQRPAGGADMVSRTYTTRVRCRNL